MCRHNRIPLVGGEADFENGAFGPLPRIMLTGALVERWQAAAKLRGKGSLEMLEQAMETVIADIEREAADPVAAVATE